MACGTSLGELEKQKISLAKVELLVVNFWSTAGKS